MASTDLDTVVPVQVGSVATTVTLYHWASYFGLLVNNLHPRVKTGTWNMQRAGYVNKKALDPGVPRRELGMLWIVQVSEGGNM